MIKVKPISVGTRFAPRTTGYRVFLGDEQVGIIEKKMVSRKAHSGYGRVMDLRWCVDGLGEFSTKKAAVAAIEQQVTSQQPA